jgi:hypothetical protein
VSSSSRYRLFAAGFSVVSSPKKLAFHFKSASAGSTTGREIVTEQSKVDIHPVAGFFRAIGGYEISLPTSPDFGAGIPVQPFNPLPPGFISPNWGHCGATALRVIVNAAGWVKIQPVQNECGAACLGGLAAVNQVANVDSDG